MIVTAIDIQLTLPPPKTPRSEGVHLSSIIRCIAIENGILSKTAAEELSLVDAREITDPVAVLRISIGLAWEQYYIPEILAQTQGVVDHPGEMYVDGIYMTHDGEAVSVIITADHGTLWGMACHEVKATYKSTRTVGTLETQWLWLAQMKGYCKGLGTRFAFMHCLFLCGDYTYPIRPLLRCWQIEFTQDEIDANWSLMTDYKAHREALENN